MVPERRRETAPPGTFYEVDESRLHQIEPDIERFPARKAMILAYRADPPTTTNVAVAYARQHPPQDAEAADLSLGALKRADAYLKSVGVVRPRFVP